MLDLSSNVSAGETGGEHTTKCVWLPWDPWEGCNPGQKATKSAFDSAEGVNHPKVIVSTAWVIAYGRCPFR